MAAVKIKPVSSGSYVTYTGKTTVGLPAVPPLSHAAQQAANAYGFYQGAYGASNTGSTRNAKVAAAAGILLQYS
jgi:hypothetical protein